MGSDPAGPGVRRLALGIMTGTSLDGLDAAVVTTTGLGLNIRIESVRHASSDLPANLREQLRQLADGGPTTPADIAQAARTLGEVYARAARALVNEAGVVSSDLVLASLHGQTILHRPDRAISWQLFDPWPVASELGCPVVYDLRQADLAAGGQGAPITPLADWLMFRQHADAVVNLGGVVNVTTLGETIDDVGGGDVVPCNLLLDALAWQYLNQPYDTDGTAALSGTVDAAVASRCDDLIERSISGQTTLGREQATELLIDAMLKVCSSLSPEDALRTATSVIAGRIAEAVSTARRVLLGGGGAKNEALIEELRRALTDATTVGLTSDVGVPIEAREAAAMAVLGLLAADGVPITLSRVTGRGSAVARDGVWIGGPPES